MKVFVTGGAGQLGYDLIRELNSRGYNDVFAPTKEELDITDTKKVEKVITDYKPDVIYHCAAYTAVDKAEENKELCYNINVNGTKNIVEVAKKLGSKVVYISTDYVFDGEKEGLYVPNDLTEPVNYYGLTKLGGEKEVSKLDNYLIVRISWIFGINGNNFVKTMLKLSESRNEINVVSDQVGSPTYTKDLSRLLVDMVENDKIGIFHATNEEFCSWYEFAKYIFEVNGVEIKVNPILTKDYVTVAKRPLNSKMSKDKLEEEGLERLPSWKDATERYCRILKKESVKR